MRYLLIILLLVGFCPNVDCQTIDVGGNVNIPTGKDFMINDVHINHYSGWYDYNDSITVVTPINITSNDTIQITNDARGDQTTSQFAPYGCGQIWDTATNSFDFSDLNIGDEILIRLSLNITTTSNNQVTRVYMNMASGVFNYKINDGHWVFKSTGSYQVESVIPLYIGNAETRDNPAEIMFTTDGNATVQVNGFYVSVTRR